MSINLPLLKKLCETAGAPGREEKIRDIVRDELADLCDDVSVDAIGNVTAVKRGSSDGKFMISGHMDEIAFMVSHIDDRGFLHFVPLGGFDPKTLTAQRVTVHGRKDLLGVMGTKPIHVMTEEDQKKPIKLEDYYIDIGLSVEKTRELVRIGDVVTRQRTLEPMGDLLNGKNFDDRVGVFIAIEALRAAKANKMDVYLVASAQEEVGIRGATVAAHNINPDVGVAVDITLACDVPFTEGHKYITELGKGAAIKAFDASVVPNWKLVDYMRELCEARSIPFQMEILTRGGTDTAAIQRAGSGAAAGCISVPTRYGHSVIETTHPADIEACIQLTAALIETCEKDQFAL